MAGSKTNSITLAATAARNGYQYRCVVKDANGSKVTTNAAKLTVEKSIDITTQPASATVAEGAKVTFKASNDQSATVATAEYTVILLGDVNSDGSVNISDAVALANHIVDNLDLTEVVGAEALLAADMDTNADINISDVVRIAYKSVDNYTSVLK